MSPTKPPGFSRALTRLESRLLIASTCLKCGESKLASSSDGSLQEWENDHKCDPEKPGQENGSRLC